MMAGVSGVDSSAGSWSSSVPRDPAGVALSVVIVNYRSWGDVAALVDRLAGSPALAAGACEVLVVDNASGEAIPAALRVPPPGVRLLLQGTNAGFSAGVNAGWRASTGRWLLVLNPDILPDPGFLDAVLGRVAGFEGRPAGSAPGIVGLALRNPDGSRQPSVGAFPGLARTVWEQVIPRSRRKYQPEWRHRAGRVDWVTGACFLVAAPLLADVGGMDEDFFLYYEEVALCRVASRRGWAVEFDPGLAVAHLRPLQDRAISTKMRVITRHSKLLYFRKHLPGWRAEALAWAIRGEAMARAAWCRLRGRPGARGWRAVGQMARQLRAGGDLRGVAVLALAEAVDEANDADPPAGRPARPGSRRSRGARPGSPPLSERTEPACDSRTT